VQGVFYYRHAADDELAPGPMHPSLGGYHVGDGGYHVGDGGDMEFAAAFDVDANKVGQDLSAAIFAPPNKTMRFAAVPPLGEPVQRGMTHDGRGEHLSQVITKAPGPTTNIVSVLQGTGTDVVVNYLPVGA
jgi:myo-inositol-1-phosphate synthase